MIESTSSFTLRDESEKSPTCINVTDDNQRNAAFVVSPVAHGLFVFDH